MPDHIASQGLAGDAASGALVELPAVSDPGAGPEARCGFLAVFAGRAAPLLLRLAMTSPP
jgi:hypothetical protein